MILSERVISQQGCFRRVIRYLEGWHASKGKLTMGYRGKETIQTIDLIEPKVVFEVRQENNEPAAEKKHRGS